MTADQIISRLKEGNERFVSDTLEGKFQDGDRRKSIEKKQEPFAVVLTCADSRIVPEIIFDTGLGELFVVRVAGNIANTSSIASIEYAVAHLKTKVIVVLAHESCGAVTAAVKGGDNGDNLNHLLGHILPAIKASGENPSVDEVSIKNAGIVVQDLKNNSQIIGQAVIDQKILIIPAYYHLETGIVDFMS